LNFLEKTLPSGVFVNILKHDVALRAWKSTAPLNKISLFHYKATRVDTRVGFFYPQLLNISRPLIFEGRLWLRWALFSISRLSNFCCFCYDPWKGWTEEHHAWFVVIRGICKIFNLKQQLEQLTGSIKWLRWILKILLHSLNLSICNIALFSICYSKSKSLMLSQFKTRGGTCSLSRRSTFMVTYGKQVKLQRDLEGFWISHHW